MLLVLHVHTFCKLTIVYRFCTDLLVTLYIPVQHLARKNNYTFRFVLRTSTCLLPCLWKHSRWPPSPCSRVRLSSRWRSVWVGCSGSLEPPRHLGGMRPWLGRAATSGWDADWWAPHPGRSGAEELVCRGSPAPPEGAEQCGDGEGERPQRLHQNRRGHQTMPSSGMWGLQSCPRYRHTSNTIETERNITADN